jgi:NADPH:quinone reductase
VGTMAGGRGDLDLRKLMGKRARIVGTVLRARPLEEKIALARDFARSMLPHFESGELQPVVDGVFRFDEIAEAHHRMETNVSSGKILLVW